MDSSDSLQLDEHLARLLAAFDQSIDGADANAPTIGMKGPSSSFRTESTDKAKSSQNGAALNEGSMGELLPDGEKTSSPWLPKTVYTPPPGGTPRIGRFELRKQLGKGGCGIVFLAYDPKLEREVALKIPRTEMLLSEDARRRLIREALAAAEFDHPNLVPVYETGEIGPLCFIATAFCPGQTLGEWLEKQSFPVPVRQAARVLAIVAEAVQHAHDRGVLHRDLKPNNVILQAVREDPNEMEPPVGSCQLRGENFIPRVVDFGLAKLLERGGPSETVTRQVLGTPKYMAPEQAQALHSDVGPTADVYALGVILYELLSGRAPYEGATDVEILRQSIDGFLTQPRHIRKDIPRDLEAICLKAMMRVPQKRYRTAIDFADDLRRFLDGKPTLARPLNWLGRVGRWLRRNDQAVALGVVTIIAALLFTFWMMSSYEMRLLSSDREKEKRAQAERTRYDNQLEYARNVREAFLAWRSGDSKTATTYLETAARLIKSGNESPDFAPEFLARLIAAERTTIVCPAGPISALASTPDGLFLVSGHHNGMLAIWNRATGTSTAAFQAHDRAVVYLSFQKSNELISADSQSSGKTWSISPKGLATPVSTKPANLDLPTPALPEIQLGSMTYTGGQDGIIRGWDSRQDPTPFVGEKLRNPVVSLGMDPDGYRFVATTSKADYLPYSGMKREQPIPGLPGNPIALRYPKDHPPLTLLVRDRTAIVAELLVAGLKESHRFDFSSSSLTCANLSGDGTQLITGNGLGQVNIWSTTDKSHIARLDVGEPVIVKNVVMSPDGRFAACQGGDKVFLWRVGEPSPYATLSAEGDGSLRFVPDGNRLISATGGGAIKVWDTMNGVAEFTLYGHTGQVTGLAISPNGQTLVSGGVNGEVKFWDLRVGQELMEFQRHRGPVNAIEFSANGKFLVTAGNELAIWQVAKE